MPPEARENYARMLLDAVADSGYEARLHDGDPEYPHVRFGGGGNFWTGVVYFHDYVDMLLKDTVSGTLVPRVLRYADPELHEAIHRFLTTEFPRLLPPDEWG